jgi:hypothetical protein
MTRHANANGSNGHSHMKAMNAHLAILTGLL